MTPHLACRTLAPEDIKFSTLQWLWLLRDYLVTEAITGLGGIHDGGWNLISPWVPNTAVRVTDIIRYRYAFQELNWGVHLHVCVINMSNFHSSLLFPTSLFTSRRTLKKNLVLHKPTGCQDAHAAIACVRGSLLCAFLPWGSRSEYSGAEH